MARSNTPAPAKKRAARPASERAQEQYDIAVRKVTGSEERLALAKAAVTELEAELAAAVKRRDYVALNPDLPAQPEQPAAEPADPGADA